jgi:hypothetical protein
MFTAKRFFLLLMIAVTIYAGIGAYNAAINLAAKIAARSIL